MMWKRTLFAGLMLVMVILFGVLLSQSSPTQAQVTFPTPTSVFPTPFLTPTITLTPTPELTPGPTSNAPGCLNALELDPGAIITVRSGVNIRAAPSVSSPWLANYQEPRDFIVLEGPVCADNFLWWQIRGHGLTGWVAERNAAISFIISVDRATVSSSCPPPLELVIGEEIELITGVRIRSEPSLSGLVLTVAQAGQTAIALEGTTICNQGYTWRRVRVVVLDVTYDGWMVEGSSSIDGRYFSVQTPDPSLVCHRPMDLRIGDLGRIYDPDGPPKNLRGLPGTDAPILFALVDNVPFEVIGGPVCVGQDQWWQVRIRSTTPAAGWVMQGNAPNYWLDVVVRAPTLTPSPTPTPTTSG